MLNASKVKVSQSLRLNRRIVPSKICSSLNIVSEGNTTKQNYLLNDEFHSFLENLPFNIRLGNKNAVKDVGENKKEPKNSHVN